MLCYKVVSYIVRTCTTRDIKGVFGQFDAFVIFANSILDECKKGA